MSTKNTKNDKGDLVQQARDDADDVEKQYEEGIITKRERLNKIRAIWSAVKPTSKGDVVAAEKAKRTVRTVNFSSYKAFQEVANTNLKFKFAAVQTELSKITGIAKNEAETKGDEFNPVLFMSDKANIDKAISNFVSGLIEYEFKDDKSSPHKGFITQFYKGMISETRPFLIAGIFSKKFFNSMLDKFSSVDAFKKGLPDIQKVFATANQLTAAFQLDKAARRNLIKIVNTKFQPNILAYKIQAQLVADTLKVPISDIDRTRLPHFFEELRLFNIWQQSVSNKEPFDIEWAKYQVHPLRSKKMAKPSLGIQWESKNFPKSAFETDNLKPTFEADNVKKLSWEILPPGEHPFHEIIEHWEKLQKRNSKLCVDLERLKRINELEPTEIYCGLGEFYGYYVFHFKEMDKAILECAFVGNATYVMRGDWESYSRLSKAELLKNHRENVDRVIHSGNWLSKVKRLL
jgi:hypothetical protein